MKKSFFHNPFEGVFFLICAQNSNKYTWHFADAESVQRFFSIMNRAWFEGLTVVIHIPLSFMMYL